jgi:hypothetical protein
MAAAAPSIEGNALFSEGYDRSRAERELSYFGRPIVRPSSRPGLYAITFYGKDGEILHSLIRTMGVQHTRNSPYETKIFLQGLGDPFSSLEELIEFVKKYNPSAYENPTVLVRNSNNITDPEPVMGDPQPVKGGRTRRATRRNRNSNRNRRRTVLRKRR